MLRVISAIKLAEVLKAERYFHKQYFRNAAQKRQLNSIQINNKKNLLIHLNLIYKIYNEITLFANLQKQF